MFGGGEPAGDWITEEAVVFTHSLQEEEILSLTKNIAYCDLMIDLCVRLKYNFIS